MMPRIVHGTLEQRPEVLDAVGIHGASCLFFLAVTDGTMREWQIAIDSDSSV